MFLMLLSEQRQYLWFFLWSTNYLDNKNSILQATTHQQGYRKVDSVDSWVQPISNCGTHFLAGAIAQLKIAAISKWPPARISYQKRWLPAQHAFKPKDARKGENTNNAIHMYRCKSIYFTDLTYFNPHLAHICMLLPVSLDKLLVKWPVQVSSILQWRATAQLSNIWLV